MTSMNLPPIISLSGAFSTESVLLQAQQILLTGGIVVCATDTGYLLGGDGLNLQAIRKIYQIKGRSFDKPIHVVVANLAMAHSIAYFNQLADAVFQRFLPGPLTLVLNKKPIVPDLLVSGRPSVGLRIPENPFLLQLVKLADTPITATSANRSGNATPYSVEQVLTELGEAATYVDLIIDQGGTTHTTPSTILDLTQYPARILRQGPITPAMLAEIIPVDNQ